MGSIQRQKGFELGSFFLKSICYIVVIQLVSPFNWVRSFTFRRYPQASLFLPLRATPSRHPREGQRCALGVRGPVKFPKLLPPNSLIIFAPRVLLSVLVTIASTNRPASESTLVWFGRESGMDLPTQLKSIGN